MQPDTSSSYISMRELLGLDPRECLGVCSRCSSSTFRLLQLRVIGHHVALCRSCLRQLVDLVDDDGRPPRLADYAHSEADDGPPDYGPPCSGAVIVEWP